MVKILRWVLGIGIAIWGISSLRSTLTAAAPFDANMALHIGMALLALVIAAALVASDFARLISRPILILIENLYMPANRASKPPLSFRLGRYYAATGRLSDAEKDYKRMLRFYPEETQGWIELMTLYWTWKPEDRKDDVRRACERGLRKSTDKASRSEIEKALVSFKKGIPPVDFATLAAQDKAQSGLPDPAIKQR